MVATLTTLNISVEHIEDELSRGRSCQEIAQDWSEPLPNVLAVKRAMDARNGDTSKTPAAPVAGPVPSARAAAPVVAGSAGPSLDALVSAAARSTSKRTQGLGVKLHDLASELRSRLAEEREAAEQLEAQRREQEQARADVARLEAQLAEARAKLRPSRQGGGIRVCLA